MEGQSILSTIRSYGSLIGDAHRISVNFEGRSAQSCYSKKGGDVTQNSAHPGSM